jgi:hypothetical protein
MLNFFLQKDLYADVKMKPLIDNPMSAGLMFFLKITGFRPYYAYGSAKGIFDRLLLSGYR